MEPLSTKLRIRLDLTAFDLSWKRVWMLVDCDQIQNIGQLIQAINCKYFESEQPNLRLCLDDPYEIPDFEDIQVIRDGDLLKVTELPNVGPPKKKKKKHNSAQNDTSQDPSSFSTIKKNKSSLLIYENDDDSEALKTSRKKKTSIISEDEFTHAKTGQVTKEEVPEEPVAKATRKRKRRPKNRNSINPNQEEEHVTEILMEPVVSAAVQPPSCFPVIPVQTVTNPPATIPQIPAESFEPSSKKITCDQFLLG